MSRIKAGLWVYLLLLTCAVSVLAQQPAVPASSSSTVVVPPLVSFSGVLTNVNGQPLTGVVGVTFALYQNAQGGAPLWLETQNVYPDKSGHYTVMLGSTKSTGIPAELFASGEARWLGVQVQDQAEQARVLLLSVPYALKASDAETLGGKPVSAFALLSPATAATGSASGNSLASGNASNPTVAAITGSGTTGYIPEWLSSTKLGNSALFQSSVGNLGISTTTPTQKFEVDLGNALVKGVDNFKKTGDTAYIYVGDASHSIEAIYGSGLAIGTYKAPQAVFIQDKTGYVGIGKTTPAAALDVNGTGNFTGPVTFASANTFTGNQTVNGNLSATGVVTGSRYQIGSNLFAFGSYVGANAFLGFAGNTTMTGNGNTASGYLALNANTTGNNNTASGWWALASNNTGYDNTASGAEALYSNTVGVQNTAVGDLALFSNVGDSAGDGWYNTAVGAGALQNNNDTSGTGDFANNNTASGYGALYNNNTGYYNTATGSEALGLNTTGWGNTASGYGAIFSNTTGWENTAVGGLALFGVTSGNDLTCIGYKCTADPPNLTNATAIGAHAVVGQSNSLVLGGTGEHAVKVGIGTTTPSNILTIGRGLGHPVSDSWETYSSRRWKTNIHALPDALAKVEQLRGVSYDLKDSGKHEIGVIAEEVGEVVPEVVSYEKNGKDARGVDYSRLTALLIEAVKQQQREISALRTQLRKRVAKETMLGSRLERLEQSQGRTQLASARPVR